MLIDKKEMPIKLYPPNTLNISKCTQNLLTLPDINISIPEEKKSQNASIIIVSKKAKTTKTKEEKNSNNEELF